MPYADPDKAREYYRQWRIKNAAKIKTDQRAYQATHRKQINAKRREWAAANADVVRLLSQQDYERHREARMAKHRTWAKHNPDKIKQHAAKTRQSDTYKQWRVANRDRLNKRGCQYKRMSNPKWAAWVRANRDKINTRAKEYRRQSLAYQRWKTANRSAAVERVLRHYYRHHELMKEYQRLFNSGKGGRLVIAKKLEACDNICYICGLHLPTEAFTIDHVIPKANGGTNHIDNLMPVHATCNNRKNNKLDFPLARPELVISSMVPAQGVA